MSNLTLYRTHSYGSAKHTYTIVVFLMWLEASNFCDTFCCIRIEEKLINHNPTAMELIQRYFSEGCLWASLPLTPMASPVLLSKLKYYKLGATPLWSSCLNPRISLGGGAVVRDFSLPRLQRTISRLPVWVLSSLFLNAVYAHFISTCFFSKHTDNPQINSTSYFTRLWTKILAPNWKNKTKHIFLCV